MLKSGSEQREIDPYNPPENTFYQGSPGLNPSQSFSAALRLLALWNLCASFKDHPWTPVKNSLRLLGHMAVCIYVTPYPPCQPASQVTVPSSDASGHTSMHLRQGSIIPELVDEPKRGNAPFSIQGQAAVLSPSQILFSFLGTEGLLCAYCNNNSRVSMTWVKCSINI